MLFLRDRPRASRGFPGVDHCRGVPRLGQTIREAVPRQLKTFLLVFFVYSLGTQTAVYFAGLIATDFGFSTPGTLPDDAPAVAQRRRDVRGAREVPGPLGRFPRCAGCWRSGL